jgi:hypothetical protein
MRSFRFFRLAIGQRTEETAPLARPPRIEFAGAKDHLLSRAQRPPGGLSPTTRIGTASSGVW